MYVELEVFKQAGLVEKTSHENERLEPFPVSISTNSGQLNSYSTYFVEGKVN